MGILLRIMRHGNDWYTCTALITDPSNSELRKKTERRVTFAELVRTATVKTASTITFNIAINGIQIFITVPSTSGVSDPNIIFSTGRS
jgi:hypothetical protein